MIRAQNVWSRGRESNPRRLFTKLPSDTNVRERGGTEWDSEDRADPLSTNRLVVNDPSEADGAGEGHVERVAPQCEMRECPRRADYFWHWRMRPSVSWIPICAPCADDLAPLMLRTEPFTLAPLAEMPGPLYRGSDHVR